MFAAFDIPLTWGELFKRTARETNDDDGFGLAAQLAYYFFLALFPAVLFLLAAASFFPLTNFIDDVTRALRPIAPPEVMRFLEEQLRHLSNADSSGILTVGILGAVWSSSAAVVAIVSALNRAYDIEEGRPWWKVRLTAIGLTITLALFVLASLTLIVAGPAVAERLAASFGLGAAFEWTWMVLQWPLAFAFVSTALGLVYYFGPDADQDWAWITPGAVVATALWVVVSLALKVYVANFADYNAMYGAVGAVIVLLLWFYISGLAILVGAELNAEIEHASPHGKEPAEKVPGQRKKIGAAAARAYKARLEQAARAPAPPPPITQPVAQGSRGQMAMESTRDDRTFGEMFAELSRDTRTLLQQEITLAKTELKEKAAVAGKSAGLIAGGGLIAYGGLLGIVAAVVLALIEMGLPPWAGALIGGIVIAAIGYLLIRSGLGRLSAQEFKPQQTIETLKEDAQWLRTQVK
jgi:membrane protein